MLAALKIGSDVLEVLSRSAQFNLFEKRTIPLFDLITKLVVILFASYFLLIIWGINPMGWLASAGIVGIAVGFAAKDTLANLFSGFLYSRRLALQDRGLHQPRYRRTRLHHRHRHAQHAAHDPRRCRDHGAQRRHRQFQDHQTKAAAPRKTFEYASPSAWPMAPMSIRCAESWKRWAGVTPMSANTRKPRVRMRGFGASSLDFELLCWISLPETRGTGQPRTLHGDLQGVCPRKISRFPTPSGTSTSRRCRDPVRWRERAGGFRLQRMKA